MRMIKKAKATKAAKPKKTGAALKSDDFESVARRLGADEDKERFEAKLKAIAKAKGTR